MGTKIEDRFCCKCFIVLNLGVKQNLHRKAKSLENKVSILLPRLNPHANISNEARHLNICMRLQLCPKFVYARGEGSGETAQDVQSHKSLCCLLVCKSAKISCPRSKLLCKSCEIKASLNIVCLFDLILYVPSRIFQLTGTGLSGLNQY